MARASYCEDEVLRMIESGAKVRDNLKDLKAELEEERRRTREAEEQRDAEKRRADDAEERERTSRQGRDDDKYVSDRQISALKEELGRCLGRMSSLSGDLDRAQVALKSLSKDRDDLRKSAAENVKPKQVDICTSPVKTLSTVDKTTSPPAAAPLTPLRVPAAVPPAPLASSSSILPAAAGPVSLLLSALLSDLSLSVDSELADIRSHSHLLNLSSTSTNRELKVQLDGLTARLSAAASQQQILLFSLESLERKLEQNDPECARKLVTARNARMEKVKEDLCRTMMELDLRSGSTTGLTGDKIRELIPNARVKMEDAKKHRTKLMKKMKEACDKIVDSLGSGSMA